MASEKPRDRSVTTSVNTNVSTIRRMARDPKKQRQYRSTDEVYDAAMAEADRRGEYLSEAINQFLIDYAAQQDTQAPTSS